MIDRILADCDFVAGDVESRTRGGVAGKNCGSDNIFDGFLDDATYWTSAHFGVVAFFD